MNPLDVLFALTLVFQLLGSGPDLTKAKAAMTPDPPALEQPADARPLDDRD